MLWWIAVGIVAGWAGGRITKGSGYSPLWDFVLGVIGAIVGGGIVDLIGITARSGLVWSVLVALGGAIIVVSFFRLLASGKPA